MKTFHTVWRFQHVGHLPRLRWPSRSHPDPTRLKTWIFQLLSPVGQTDPRWRFFQPVLIPQTWFRGWIQLDLPENNWLPSSLQQEEYNNFKNEDDEDNQETNKETQIRQGVECKTYKFQVWTFFPSCSLLFAAHFEKISHNRIANPLLWLLLTPTTPWDIQCYFLAFVCVSCPHNGMLSTVFFLLFSALGSILHCETSMQTNFLHRLT